MDARIKDPFNSGAGAHLCTQLQYFRSNVNTKSAALKKDKSNRDFFRSTEYIYYLNAIEVYAPYDTVHRETNWD